MLMYLKKPSTGFQKQEDVLPAYSPSHGEDVQPLDMFSCRGRFLPPGVFLLVH